jgi:hypothetical protein
MSGNEQASENVDSDLSLRSEETKPNEAWSLRRAVHEGRRAVTCSMPGIVSGSSETSISAVASRVDSSVSSFIHCACLFSKFERLLAPLNPVVVDRFQLKHHDLISDSLSLAHFLWLLIGGYRAVKDFTNQGHPATVLGVTGLLVAVPSARCMLLRPVSIVFEGKGYWHFE